MKQTVNYQMANKEELILITNESQLRPWMLTETVDCGCGRARCRSMIVSIELDQEFSCGNCSENYPDRCLNVEFLPFCQGEPIQCPIDAIETGSMFEVREIGQDDYRERMELLNLERDSAMMIHLDMISKK